MKRPISGPMSCAQVPVEQRRPFGAPGLQATRIFSANPCRPRAPTRRLMDFSSRWAPAVRLRVNSPREGGELAYLPGFGSSGLPSILDRHESSATNLKQLQLDFAISFRIETHIAGYAWPAEAWRQSVRRDLESGRGFALCCSPRNHRAHTQIEKYSQGSFRILSIRGQPLPRS